jgi:hypothetical protein
MTEVLSFSELLLDDISASSMLGEDDCLTSLRLVDAVDNNGRRFGCGALTGED